jgi:iron complex transport system ATP-binding protein
MKQAMPLLELQDFSFSIARREILRGLSLAVEAGEYLALLGPNGAGKSTLLKCVVRILRGGRGRLAVAGRPLAEYAQRELARIISYVPQTQGREVPFTVHEFVGLGRYPYCDAFHPLTARDEEAIWTALERTGLVELAGRLLDTLSGGERQRAFIAAALAQEARLLLLDEPAGFLDPRHQAEVHNLLARLNRESGVTVVMATHDINAAALAGRRVAALKEGRLVFDGPPKELMINQTLERIYDRSFIFVPHPGTGLPMIAPDAAEGAA